MKVVKYIMILLFSITLLSSCKKEKNNTSSVIVYECPMLCEGDKTYTEEGVCPVCKMDLTQKDQKEVKEIALATNISESSIFNLTSEWKTEENKSIHLEDLRGKTLVMVMIYTTCKAACPRLVADMRNIEAKIPKKYNSDLQYVLISIDPKNDTPEKLKAFAKENYMDDEHWTFLQGTEESVREFANVLAVKYKQISPLDFSHSNIISVFNPEGELVHQQEGLGVDNKETVASILETVKK
ncbi:SCO family protein [Tenacibaculum larymnensis]|uniref:SCO family protein n=1 Tax=Tenacibaculum larymnensis TaxID=2878201 RepID=A0A9X4ILJ0_9FLAO|nr:SCO family protein [Tenacibaculum larymnensis]MDE1206618.1 SCO family protein [Tenacibaculum larymnensis]